MSTIKIRFELNKGRGAMPLDKLVSQAEKLLGFLDSVISDLGGEKGKATWLAEEFSNGSVDFDCRLYGDVGERVTEEARTVFDAYFGNKPLDPILGFKISPGTRNYYRRLTSELDPDEVIRVALYKPGNGELGPWLLVRAGGGDVVDTAPRLGRSYYGEVQGTVSALFKERHMHLWVRDLSTDKRVKCSFTAELYPKAVQALNDPGAIIFVEGIVTEDPDTGDTVEMKVEGIRNAPAFDRKTFESMLGALPDYTAPLTTLEHSEAFRER